MGQKVKCTECKDVIESMHTHDFKWCKCETIFVDGGNTYFKCGGDFSKMMVKNGRKWIPFMEWDEETESKKEESATVDEPPEYGLFDPQTGQLATMPTTRDRYSIGRMRSSYLSYLNIDRMKRGESPLSINDNVVIVKNIHTGATIEIDPHYSKYFGESLAGSPTPIRKSESRRKEVLEDKSRRTRKRSKDNNRVRDDKKGKQRKSPGKDTSDKRYNKKGKKPRKSKRNNTT